MAAAFKCVLEVGIDLSTVGADVADALGCFRGGGTYLEYGIAEEAAGDAVSGGGGDGACGFGLDESLGGGI